MTKEHHPFDQTSRQSSQITVEEFIEGLEERKDYLIPKGLLISEYFVIDSRKTALQHLANEQVSFSFQFMNQEKLTPFVNKSDSEVAEKSILHHKSLHSQRLVFFKDELDGHVALSHGSILKTGFGCEWYITLYTEHISALLAGLIHQLTTGISLGCNFICCFYPEKLQHELEIDLSQVKVEPRIVLKDKVVFLEKKLAKKE